MNRQARRAAARGKTKAPGTPPEIALWFDAALDHQQAGRTAEAARLYDRILAADPSHLNSLQNLGLIALLAGRHDLAVNQFTRALALNAAQPDQHHYMAVALQGLGRSAEALAHCQRTLALKADHLGARTLLGEILQAQGKHDEALACYERVLAVDPGNEPALANLATVMAAKGRFAEASQAYERALALNPDNPLTHSNFGIFHHDRGDLERAIGCYVRAMELKPEHLDAHYNFCAALLGLSQFDAAAAYYEQFLPLKPDFIAGYSHLALAYNGAGKTQEALAAVQRGLAKAETPFGKSVFVQCLRNLTTAPDEALRDLIVRAVSEPWTRPNELTRQCVALIKANAEIAACIERAGAAWPSHPSGDELYGRAGLNALSHDTLLRVYLENSRVSSLDMELFLTAVRAVLLETAASAQADTALAENTLAFYGAIARQCFIAEYAFLQSDMELSRVNVLRDAVTAALRADAPIHPIQLASIAAYGPLHSLTESEKLLTRAWPMPIDALLTQQIREPAEERRLRVSIPALTPIDDRRSSVD